MSTMFSSTESLHTNTKTQYLDRQIEFESISRLPQNADYTTSVYQPQKLNDSHTDINDMDHDVYAEVFIHWITSKK